MKIFDDILVRYTEKGLLPNTFAGVADLRGEIYTGAAGKKNIDHAESLSANAVVAIASMTKPVTTVAALQLAERKLLDLDAPVTDYLPELSELKVLQGFDGSEAILVSAPVPPTTRQLLMHTSGFVYEFWNANAARLVEEGGAESIFTPSTEFLEVPLSAPPGTRWEYGIGIDWAGRVVESVSGKALDQYFFENIFSPLGMKNTAFSVAASNEASRSALHSRENEVLKPIPHMHDLVSGGGGLNSTMSDYLVFLRMLLNDGTLDGERILGSETVEGMFRNQIGDFYVLPGSSCMPQVSKDFDMGFGVAAKWGLGFLLHESQTDAGRPAGSASWAGLFNTYFWIDRKNGLCALAGSQLLPFYDDYAVALLKEFEAAVYSELT